MNKIPHSTTEPWPSTLHTIISTVNDIIDHLNPNHKVVQTDAAGDAFMSWLRDTKSPNEDYHVDDLNLCVFLVNLSRWAKRNDIDFTSCVQAAIFERSHDNDGK